MLYTRGLHGHSEAAHLLSVTKAVVSASGMPGGVAAQYTTASRCHEVRTNCASCMQTCSNACLAHLLSRSLKQLKSELKHDLVYLEVSDDDEGCVGGHPI